MPDREMIMKWLEELAEPDWKSFHSVSEVQIVAQDALALLEEYKQSEQSYLRTLVELSNERDKLLKELGREDEHKYKDGSFMAGGNGIVKL